MSKIDRAKKRASAKAATAKAKGLPELAMTRRPSKQGKARMRQIRAEQDPQKQMLKARARRWKKPESQWREMRDPWWGCEAGGAMASAILSTRTRQVYWEAIQHVRATVIEFDRAIGAPNRHAQCLRLMLPNEEMRVDITLPLKDTRTDEQKQERAVQALQIMEERLGRSGLAAMAEAMRVVVDDQPCTDARLMLAALCHVVELRAGR